METRRFGLDSISDALLGKDAVDLIFVLLALSRRCRWWWFPLRAVPNC